MHSFTVLVYIIDFMPHKPEYLKYYSWIIHEGKKS